MHLPYMCAFIYEDLRKLSSVYAHLYAHLYASSIYEHIWKCAYTKDVIMEVANFRICIVRICTYMHRSYMHLSYMRCSVYGSGQLPYMHRSYMHIYGSAYTYMKGVYTDNAYTEGAYTEGAYIKEIYCNPNASSVYVCFHI
jgi:hypothetical protein